MRERWRQRVKEGKIKQIKDLTEIEQRKRRKNWKHSQRKSSCSRERVRDKTMPKREQQIKKADIAYNVTFNTATTTTTTTITLLLLQLIIIIIRRRRQRRRRRKKVSLLLYQMHCRLTDYIKLLIYRLFV